MAKPIDNTEKMKEVYHKTAMQKEELLKQLEIAEQKIKQLETTLSLFSKKNLIEKVTPEELICIEQIAMLKIRSSSRSLELEEVKKLDILIKSLKLVREENPKESITTTAPTEEDDLVAIAAGTTSNN